MINSIENSSCKERIYFNLPKLLDIPIWILKTQLHCNPRVTITNCQQLSGATEFCSGKNLVHYKYNSDPTKRRSRRISRVHCVSAAGTLASPLFIYKCWTTVARFQKFHGMLAVQCNWMRISALFPETPFLFQSPSVFADFYDATVPHRRLRARPFIIPMLMLPKE